MIRRDPSRDIQVEQWETHPSLFRANRCLVGDGTRVPLDEAEDAEELSSSRLSSRGFIESNTGASGGNFANLDLAKDF